MRKCFLVAISILMFTACTKRSIVDVPIDADNFEGLQNDINVVCAQIERSACTHLQDAITFELPLNTLTDTTKYIDATNRIYDTFNNKTPREIIEIYKTTLIKNLDAENAKNIKLKKELQKLYEDYETTRQYANNIAISNIKYDFTDLDNPLITFSITNGMEHPIDQLVAEAEFYSSSDIFLGRAKAFVQPFKNAVAPGDNVTIKKTLQSIPAEDLELIKIARNLKIKISVPSIQTVMPNNNTEIYVLSLPYSYIRMQELLAENQKLYDDTIRKIKAITID